MTHATGEDEKPILRAGGRVAVIGAGASGVESGRQLRAHGYETYIFERSGYVGGIWEKTSPIKSPMYSSLKSNLPKYAMMFDRQLHTRLTSSFLSHSDVAEYLRWYCEKHKLGEMIRFHHEVVRVFKDTSSGKWTVITQAEERREWEFDAVFICSGHFSKPLPWTVDGFEYLKQNNIHVEHSVVYDAPHEDKYEGKNIIVIGAGPSGVDISLELSKVASTLYLSHSKEKAIVTYDKPNNFREVSRITRVLSDGTIQLESGDTLNDIDTIVTCNGYQREYAYLETDAIQLSEDNVTIFGLLRHCICVKDPTLVFVGVPTKPIPFPTFEYQVAFATAVLQRKAISKERFFALVEEERLMLEAFRKEHQRDDGGGKWWKEWHVLGPIQWDYICELGALIKRQPVPKSVIELTQYCSRIRESDPVNYRRMHVDIHGDGSGMWSVTNVTNGNDAIFGKEVEA